MSVAVLRHIFSVLNRFFMVPCFRLGLGPFMGNPLSGYIMVWMWVLLLLAAALVLLVRD